MLEELLPRNLTETAKAIGVDPFEVVRLLVASDKAPEELRFGSEAIGELKSFSGVDSWWDDATLPDDTNAYRARVRGSLQQLVDRGLVGETSTRMDNVWRGLSAEEQDVLQQALGILVEEGHLHSFNAPAGIQVSINAQSLDTIKGIADGSASSPGLSALLGG